VASSNTVAVAVKEQAKGEALVAVVKPDEPVTVIQAPSNGENLGAAKQVVLDSVDYDSKGNIVFSGRSRPGYTVRLYVDNAPTGELKANDQGKWTFNGSTAITTGTHTLRADEVDPAGKVVSRVELPFQREEAEKVALAQPENTESQTQQIGSKTVGNNAVPQRIIIQPGNNLWRLSRMVYGKGTQFTVIYEANKDQIRDPDLIYPGQLFAVPVKP
jgi:nucleoid-associated protein YgaU